VGIAQLVERRLVVADVAGSSPVTHPRQIEPPTSSGRGLESFPGGTCASLLGTLGTPERSAPGRTLEADGDVRR
jgi:hypothetical protein